jgi:hypothetical protein
VTVSSDALPYGGNVAWRSAFLEIPGVSPVLRTKVALARGALGDCSGFMIAVEDEAQPSSHNLSDTDQSFTANAG